MLLAPSLKLNDETGKSVTLRKAGVFGQSIYIIPRSHCSFRRVGLVNKGHNASKAVLLRLKKEALSANSHFKVVPDKAGRRAGAWEFQHSDPADGYRFLPESLARQPLENGTRLVECLEGYEGQIWYEGNLVSSRWWSEKPSEKGWVVFVRAAEVEVDVDYTQIPHPELVDFRRDIPIWEFNRERALQIFSPVNVAMAGITAFCCIAAFSSAQLVHYWMEINENTQKVENISTETEQIISQRSRALRNVSHAKKFENIGHKGAVILAVKQVSEVLKGEGLLLSWIRYDTGDLEIGLATDQREDEAPIEIPTLVADLETKSALSNVSMSVRSRKLLTINAEVILASEGPDGQIPGR